MFCQIDRGVLTLLLILGLIVLIGVGCGGDAASEPTVDPTAVLEATATPEPTASSTAIPEPTVSPTAIPEPTATPTATPEPTIASTPTGGGAVMGMTIDADATWQYVFDSSSASVQDCIRGALNANLSSALENPVTEDFWAEDLYPCLEPETVRDIFLIAMLAEIGEDTRDLTVEEESCLRDATAGIEVAAMMMVEESAEYAEGVAHLLACIPDLVISVMIGEVGLRLEDLSREEASCLRVLIKDPDTFAAMSSPEDSAEFTQVMGRMVACIPDVFISLMIGESGGRIEDLSEEETSCLRELLTSSGVAALFASEDSAERDDFFERLGNCAPAALYGQN